MSLGNGAHTILFIGHRDLQKYITICFWLSRIARIYVDNFLRGRRIPGLLRGWARGVYISPWARTWLTPKIHSHSIMLHTHIEMTALMIGLCIWKLWLHYDRTTLFCISQLCLFVLRLSVKDVPSAKYKYRILWLLCFRSGLIVGGSFARGYSGCFPSFYSLNYSPDFFGGARLLVVRFVVVDDWRERNLDVAETD